MISSARVAFAAAIMEARTADGDRPDSSTAKAASYHCTPMRVAAGSDSSLQDIWHWPEPQALILERHAANLIG